LLSDGKGGGFLGGGWETFSPIIFFMKNLSLSSEPITHPTEKIKHKKPQQSARIREKKRVSLAFFFSS
jgi:hypothetical protein